MLHINVTEVNTYLMSLSIITFALSSFSTSYSIINSVQERIKQRISIAEGGVPYKLSGPYKYLKNANLFSRAKRNRIYCILIAITFLMNIAIMLFRPINSEKYTMGVREKFSLVLVSIEDESTYPLFKACKMYDESTLEQNDEANESVSPSLDISSNIVGYYIASMVLMIITIVILILLLVSYFKILQIQLKLLDLERDPAFSSNIK